MNRKDAVLTQQIAHISMRDAESLKIIALLTMAFLPGTWAATFIGLPMFDWTASSGAMILRSRWFWVYWAITLPLTLIVFLVWPFWLKHKRQQRPLPQVDIDAEG